MMNQYQYNLTESLHQFDNDRRQYENAINTYRGPDPLNLWWRYICWLEQNIHIDTENQFRKSLEQCLSIFENYDVYKNDVRLVKLWIKYIDMQANQPQLYQMLYQRGIGTQLAAFYIAWTHYYDSAGAFKHAESIFNLAIQTNAQPMEELKAAQNKFLMSVAQRMLYDDGSSKKRSADNLAEQRQQITTLNPQQKRTRSDASQQMQQNPSAVPPPASSQVCETQESASGYNYNSHPQQYNSQPQYDTTPPTLNNSANVISSSLSYVYDETKIEDSNHVDYNVVYDYESGIQLPQGHSKSAKNHHEMWRVSLYLDEPFEQKRCFYQRQLVYPGDGTEYSPEEIRSRKWYRRDEEIKMRKRQMQQKQEEERARMQQERQKQILKQQQEEKRRQMEEQRRQQELQEQEKQQQVYLQNQYRAYQPNYGIKQPQNDDIEDQIEASTISFSSGEDGTNKRITIKFKRERTIETHEIQPEPAPVTPKYVQQRKKQTNRTKYLSGYDQTFNGNSNGYNNRQVEDANLLLSLSNGDTSSTAPAYSAAPTPDTANDDSFSSYSNDNSNNGFSTSTPIRQARQKNLKKTKTNMSNINEDSQSSYADTFVEDDEDAKKRKLDKALQCIETHFARKSIDPFSSELCQAFLTKVDFPNATTENCAMLNFLPKFAKSQDISIGGSEFYIDREVGRGAYGAVYRALNTRTNEVVALKYQKPANPWEFYICQQVRKRCISSDMLTGFMHISLAVVAQNCTALVSEFSNFGSLLDINNKIRAATTKVMHESLVMHFTYQILSIVQHLHTCKIVHADIKPDNFLLMKTPDIESNQPTLRLIDFGCAIDMTLFKKGTEFTKVIQTDGFTCIEMMEGKPWSYQTDLFCVAGTIHVMLFGEYMTLTKSGKNWDIKNKYPRYLKKHVWSEIFNKLLNIKDINHLPDLNHLKSLLDNEIWNMESELNANIRTLNNLIKPPIIKRTNRRSMNKSADKSGLYNNTSATTYTTLETIGEAAAPAVV